MSKVFIIGNGFDLDLGLKTRYIDFWKSELFENYRRTKRNGLIAFLNRKADENSSWFDIEALLREYVHLADEHTDNNVSPNDFERDKNEFNEIRLNLASFLELQIEHQTLNKRTMAARVLKEMVKVDSLAVYTFNYTNLYKIAEKLEICQKFDYKSVHGRSSDKTLILGINDDVDVVPNFEFTYKTFSPYYQSVPLRFDLEEADEVVIFGLAMGNIDYPYFQDFFRHICNPKNSRDDRKRVTIFTYDENSRLSILRRLRAMNEKRVNYMFGQNEFEFIRTSDPNDELKLARFLRRLEKEINL